MHRREYYALISHLDQQIGRILDSLERSGKADNTWIFFTSDHGLAVGNHGLFGKQNMYDHSIRVPFIVVGPSVPADHRISAPIYLQDAMATSLELAGIKRPEWVEFRSLVPLIQGKTNQSPYAAIYGAYTHLQRCVVVDNWKLIQYPTAGVVRLYDLKNDPLELRDVANGKEHATRIIELLAELQDLQIQFDDPLRKGN